MISLLTPNFQGLKPVNDVSKLTGKGKRFLVEAVINQRSALIGHTPKSLGFRTKYNAAIIAVHRGGLLVKVRTRFVT